MKTFFHLIVLAFFILLTACSNTNNDDIPSGNEQDESTEEQTDQASNEEADEEQPAPNETDEPELESEPESPDEDQPISEEEIVLENDAFKIISPSPDAEVRERIVVRGLARVFEGTIQYEFEDGHYILDKGFTTASEGGPGWGEFEISIELDDEMDGAHRIVLYEESAKDGSRIHELILPVHVRK